MLYGEIRLGDGCLLSIATTNSRGYRVKVDSARWPGEINRHYLQMPEAAECVQKILIAAADGVLPRFIKDELPASTDHSYWSDDYHPRG